MRNEQGLTLIELLAALAISTIALSTAYMLFNAVYGLWYNTEETYKDASSIQRIEQAITQELADPVSLYYIHDTPDQKELQFQTFDGTFKSLMYDMDSKTLSLYHLPDATSLPETERENHAELAEISEFHLRNEDGTLIDASGALPEDERLSIEIGIAETHFRTNGESTVRTKTVNIPVRPFQLE